MTNSKQPVWEEDIIILLLTFLSIAITLIGDSIQCLLTLHTPKPKQPADGLIAIGSMKSSKTKSQPPSASTIATVGTVDLKTDVIMNKALPSQSKLKELFNYDPETGVFTYKIKPNFRIKIGSIAGTIKTQGVNKGYCFIKIDGHLYHAARLAWMYVHGVDPGDMTIDHVDRNQSNNSINNLRLATLSQQAFNRRTNNKLARNIWYNDKTSKYIAQFNFRKAGITTSKSFNTLEDAVEYANAIRREYGKEFAVIDDTL